MLRRTALTKMHSSGALYRVLSMRRASESKTIRMRTKEPDRKSLETAELENLCRYRFTSTYFIVILIMSS